MSCSFRRLKIFEIVDGISIRPDSICLDSTTKLQRRVLDLCRPLVEDGPSDTLVFVHFSAKQYVLDPKPPSLATFSTRGLHVAD
jgi:hypothetical protein